jgi:hypothetical protein
MTVKTVDKKGRLMLGSNFAGRLVIVDDTVPGKVTVSPAVAIPEREAWLYDNEIALRLVRAGLEEARAGEFSKSPPDLKADAALIADPEG